MAGITLAQAQTLLDAAVAAYTKALKAKGYNVGSRGAQRHDIDKLSAEVNKWEAKVRELTRGSGGIRIRGATPV